MTWDHIGVDENDNYIFRRVFWTFRFTIDDFSHCRPVLCIDATHLYGRYDYKLLGAVAIDANNFVCPIVYAFVPSEGGED